MAWASSNCCRSLLLLIASFTALEGEGRGKDRGKRNTEKNGREGTKKETKKKGRREKGRKGKEKGEEGRGRLIAFLRK